MRDPSVITTCFLWRSTLKPASRLAWRTHFRSVSAVQPSFGATDCNTPNSDAWVARCSSTILTARSRTSGENRLGRPIDPIPQAMRSPRKPVRFMCSIDEFAATVAPRGVPAALTHQIKQRLRDAVGDHITCSIGYAPNRWLAKIAAALDKPDGLTVLHPRDLPGRLLTLDLEDVPGVATRMRTRLARWGLTSVEDLWQADPLQLRAAWGSVTGVRLWYALHGYAVAPPRTQRRSIGHGRVLPPSQRQASAARILARQLVVKAARRMRREGYLAQRLTLSVDCLDAPYWTAAVAVAAANDDRAGLEALAGLWAALGGRVDQGRC